MGYPIVTAVTQASDYTLTSSDAAVMLGVSDETIRRWCDDGRVRYLRLPSGHRRFRPEDLDDLLTVVEPTTGGRWDSEGTYLEREQ